VVIEGCLDVLHAIDESGAKIFVRSTGHDVWAVTEQVKNVLLMWQ